MRDNGFFGENLTPILDQIDNLAISLRWFTHFKGEDEKEEIARNTQRW
jgi:hypothetical protein